MVMTGTFDLPLTPVLCVCLADINECESFNNLCVFGRCINTIGMFQCKCNEGYELDDSKGSC